MAKKNNLRIVITSGDQDGIGPEVTAKALAKIGPQSGINFILWRSPVFHEKYLSLIDKKFKRRTVHSWAEAIQHLPAARRELIDINSMTPPPLWVEWTAQAAKLKEADALVTAPLSKTLIRDAGLADLGHTDILARITGAKDLFMTFLGSRFHLLLATGHQPLTQVSKSLTPAQLETALRAAHHVAHHLKKKGKLTLPVGLVGVNPHAGEEGMIGNEERTVYKSVLEKLPESLLVEGPLVPDAAFLPSRWKKYSIYVAPYHDQGLIPFKMVHEGRGGCHLTMGLPFVRTSVDHGTAKDIFGQNRADSSSMQDALLQAILLCQNSFRPDGFLSSVRANESR